MRTLVIPDVHGLIEIHGGVVHSGTGRAANPQLVERRPVLNGHDGIDERYFHSVMQCLFLFCRQFLAHVRDNHIPAGEHGTLAPHYVSLVLATVRDLYLFRGCRIAYVLYSHGCAAETHADGRTVA